MGKILYGYENQILLKNAYASWVQAIKNARNIKNGFVTLQYKKTFIATLHNAVELFLKQLMLNQKDYRIAKVRAEKLDSNGEPLKSYYQSLDLNEYFKKLTIEIRKLYISIEFSELVQLHKDLLGTSLNAGTSYTTELKLLQRLRNDETHFYIEPDEFLTDIEFVTLHNFMVDFHKTLKAKNLIPSFDMPINEESLLCFSDTKITTSFSFRGAVKKAPKVKAIAIILDNQLFRDFAPPYELAEIFEKDFLMKGISFDEAYCCIEAMFDYGLLDFQEEHSVTENEHGILERIDEGYRITCKV